MSPKRRTWKRTQLYLVPPFPHQSSEENPGTHPHIGLQGLSLCPAFPPFGTGLPVPHDSDGHRTTEGLHIPQEWACGLAPRELQVGGCGTQARPVPIHPRPGPGAPSAAQTTQPPLPTPDSQGGGHTSGLCRSQGRDRDGLDLSSLDSQLRSSAEASLQHVRHQPLTCLLQQVLSR